MLKLLTATFTRTNEGTTERLLQLSFGYFGLYVIVGVLAKYFEVRYGMKGITYTVYNTLGGMLICNAVAIALGWYKFKSSTYIEVLGLRFPAEFLYIIPSGVCTAIVIPTTTLMYTLPISVMVAMIIMRASVIIISRAVDTIQISQGILKKKVFWEENIAVVFALLAVSLKMYYVAPGDFDFINNTAAMTILTAYLCAYSIRIYIFNYYKNTRPANAVYDTNGFFAIEQFSSSIALLLAGALFFYFVPASLLADTKSFAFQFTDSLRNPPANWGKAILSGLPFGIAAFFSVFLFMFKGRTATFAGLVNRLTSLMAGTGATLLTWKLLGGKPPKPEDWWGLAFILIAIYFMSRAEKKRACELALANEIPSESACK